METAERLIIFSGTTEGRLLSDRLCAVGLHHIVSVASGYGSDMMREDPSREVHEGRMDAEEMWIRALEPEPAGVIVDIVNHPPELTFLMENTIVIARGDGFPYAVTARKNASKMLDALCCSLLIAHFGDIIVAGDIHPFVSCGTRAFETAYHITYALWQQLLHVQYYMDMIRHNLRCKDFDGVAFTRVEMRQVL